MAEKNQLSLNETIEKVNVIGDTTQKYILGTKKSGRPRAVYDVLRDYVPPKSKSKKKKNKKKDDHDGILLYLNSRTNCGGKSKKKKKKNKYWHI